MLDPRLWVPDDFSLCRYLAAGLAAFAAVDPGIGTDLAALADELDAEALRNSVSREVFTNPAKALADRMAGRQVALAADRAATLALARHAGAVLLRVAGQPVAAVGLADVMVALRTGLTSTVGASVDALFHDEEIDGPLPGRPRIIALSLTGERTVLSARLAGYDDVELLGSQDVGPDVGVDAGTGSDGRTEHQLAVLALRLEMAAVYLRLAGG